MADIKEYIFLEGGNLYSPVLSFAQGDWHTYEGCEEKWPVRISPLDAEIFGINIQQTLINCSRITPLLRFKYALDTVGCDESPAEETYMSNISANNNIVNKLSKFIGMTCFSIPR